MTTFTIVTTRTLAPDTDTPYRVVIEAATEGQPRTYYHGDRAFATEQEARADAAEIASHFDYALRQIGFRAIEEG